MTDKPLNPSVDNSGARGSALTPQQAAKACITKAAALIDCPDATLEARGIVLAELEREFTEIISQVNFSVRLQANLTSEKPEAVEEFRDLILGPACSLKR